MAVAPLILVANPGSASRKYALWDNNGIRAQLHIEHADGGVVCTCEKDGQLQPVLTNIQDIAEAPLHCLDWLRTSGALAEHEEPTAVGLRIVAPGAFFLQDRLVDDNMVQQLERARSRAPLHIAATLEELRRLQKLLPSTQIVGVSDSAFHHTKPDYAWNYGLPLADADRLDIKRFGYHGISVGGAVRKLGEAGKLTPHIVVCHIGSGVSVTAVHGGRSLDTTMGYSPLEGTIMATRSGSIDVIATRVLREELGLGAHEIEDYLQSHGGLLGLGGSPDIRELLKREAAGDHLAELALQTYVHHLQMAIGQMAAALGSIDMVVFTGTVGERSAPIRERILKKLHFLDFIIDPAKNNLCLKPTELTLINRAVHSKPICVIPTNEAIEIAEHTAALST